MFGLKRSGCVLAMILGAATPVMAQQPSPAGHIKTVVRRRVHRARQRIDCRRGRVTAVFETDALRTGADGTVGVTLKDDTRLSLGPNSEVRLERYVYAPGEGGFGMVLKFVARRRRLRVRPHGEARARLDPPRNAGRHRRRPRDDRRDSRRAVDT